MINLINTYVEMQKKLDEEHGIIGVSTSGKMPEVHVYELDRFLEVADGREITVVDREDSDFPYGASFVKNNISFIVIFGKLGYERIIKIEGVKHE